MGVTRQYIYGYRTDDFLNREFDKNFEAIRDNVLTSIHINPAEKHKSGKRKIMGVSLPWSYKGACELKPDDNDLASIIDGAKHRVGGIVPPIDRRRLRGFKRFVAIWLKKYLNPLSGLTVIDLESWLETTNYSLTRKEQLRNCYTIENEKYVRPDFQKLLSFIKDEFYPEPKAFRTINSRDDYYKCVLGPWIHAVEKEVFKHDEFIKLVPVEERAKAVYDKYIYGDNISTTDFTAWEASIGPDIMKACEFQLFKHMTQEIPENKEFLDCYHKLCFQNTLKFNGLVVTLISRRMSGEMSTSIGNGFTNLMLLRYTCFLHGINARIYVEGDDGVIFSDKPIPIQIFTDLGFIVKMETHTDPRRAKFCSLIFDDNFNLLRDPIHTILRLGWSSQQYINSSHKVLMNLLRLKAISLKCEVPNCPILGPLADRLLFLTREHSGGLRMFMNKMHLNLYERERLTKAMETKRWLVPSKVTPEARVLVEEEFGIHVESQLFVERQLAGMELGHYQSPVLDQYIRNDQKTYYDVYSSPSKDYSNTIDTRRVCEYASFLPRNPIADRRDFIPAYAA